MKMMATVTEEIEEERKALTQAPVAVVREETTGVETEKALTATVIDSIGCSLLTEDIHIHLFLVRLEI